MPRHPESVQSPRQFAEQVLTRSEAVLREAVAIAYPETPDIDRLQAFPEPSELRAQSPDIPSLTDERRTALVANTGELGFGRAENVTLSEQGLTGAYVVLEGGQPHKMVAEAQMVAHDPAARPVAFIIAVNPHRELKDPAEIASAERLFGYAGPTEYDTGFDAARSLPRFRGLQPPRVLNAAYDTQNFTTSREPSGQFQAIGQTRLRHVILMQVDSIELGENTAALLGIVDAVIKQSGDTTTPLAYVTSGTYRPSREIGVAIAGLATERLIGLGTYGNDLLNEVKGTNAPSPADQLPAELHAMAAQAVDLRRALAA